MPDFAVNIHETKRKGGTESIISRVFDNLRISSAEQPTQRM
jgi:hypothetical protein